MSVVNRAGRRIERVVARYFDGDLPERESLPWYVAPLPGWLEDVALRLAWPIAIVNLVGTAFGFWYYGFQPLPTKTPLFAGQFALTSPVVWPLVPDSPVATLLIGLSLIAFKRGWDAGWVPALHALAFFGCIKLGLWTPYVQLVVNGLGSTPLWLYHFLIWSHLAMSVEAFVVHRYSDFPVWAVAVATGWYLFNDVADYFVAIATMPTHTLLPDEFRLGTIDHSVPAHDLAAAAAVVLTVLATFLLLATRIEKLKARVE
ncbi:MAG: DUF1405 domain-containing protein [Halorhabdus sp.]